MANTFCFAFVPPKHFLLLPGYGMHNSKVRGSICYWFFIHSIIMQQMIEFFRLKMKQMYLILYITQKGSLGIQ